MEDKASRIRLVNFNAPQHLLSNFDHIVRFKSTSRTSTLLGLMEQYVRHEREQLERDDTFNQRLCEMDERNRKSLSRRITDTVRRVINAEMAPPSIQWDRGNDW